MMKKILFGIPPKNHVILALDEVSGFQELGYKCETITYGRNNQKISKFNKLIGVFKNALELVKCLHQFQPDILYLNSRFEKVGSTRDFITIAIIRLCYYKSLAISIKTHGSDFSFITKSSLFFDSIVIPFLSKNVYALFFLSNQERSVAVEKKPSLSNIAFVTQNIIDPKRSVRSSAFLERHLLNDERLKFFFAGRMIHEKGIFTILKSIAAFKHRENCIFILAGNGNEFARVKSEIKRLRLEKYVYLPGFVKEEECDHFYANTDVLVFPTYFDEGFPMVLFKAIGSGMPVITTHTRAAIDYLTEPENCLWVDGKDESTVTKAITRLYEDQVLRNKMTKNNLELGKRFTKLNVCAEMDKVFSEHFENV